MARVLVVEDNEVNLELLQYLLQACGHQVEMARDGIEGLERLRAWRPDLVLCDIELPRMDGVSFARAVRADPGLGALPLLAVTANAMGGDRARFLAAGFDDYIAKPIDPDRFVPWIEQRLREGSRPAQAAAPHPAPPQAPTTPTPAADAPLVLVVDDQAANLSLKQSCLEPLGYRVRTAVTATEALVLALAEPPQLIISDVGMQEGDGFEFIVRVRQHAALREVPFIFVSSTHRDDIAREKALSLGARRYLHRPLPVETLIHEVAQVIGPPARPGNA